jgi:hypothetical protein
MDTSVRRCWATSYSRQLGGVVRRGRVDTPDRGGRSKTRDSVQKPKKKRD